MPPPPPPPASACGTAPRINTTATHFVVQFTTSVGNLTQQQQTRLNAQVTQVRRFPRHVCVEVLLIWNGRLWQADDAKGQRVTPRKRTSARPMAVLPVALPPQAARYTTVQSLQLGSTGVNVLGPAAPPPPAWLPAPPSAPQSPPEAPPAPANLPLPPPSPAAQPPPALSGPPPTVEPAGAKSVSGAKQVRRRGVHRETARPR